MERVRYDLLLVINTLTLAVVCNSAIWAVLLCVSAHQHRVPFLGIQLSNVPSRGSLEHMPYLPLSYAGICYFNDGKKVLRNAGRIEQYSLIVSHLRRLWPSYQSSGHFGSKLLVIALNVCIFIILYGMQSVAIHFAIVCLIQL